MATMTELQAVIAANREQQQKARNLNIRAGEQVFPVMTRSEWEGWLKQRLNGAMSASTIVNLEMIRLPLLEQDLVDLVLTENPDLLTVLGRQLPVSYQSGYSPSITLEGDGVTTSPYIWRNLPDEGVKLPGGRLIQVACKTGYWDSISDSNIPQLKEKMRNHLNREQWDRWTERPVITPPDPNDENAQLPNITIAVYGRCVVTGDPLNAYGTVTATRYWSSDPIRWGTEWFRIGAEAEEAYNKAKTLLEAAKAEAQDKREYESIKATGEAAKEKARKLYGDMPYDAVDYTLRDKLYNRAYSWLPSSASELRQWIVDTEAVIAEVETGIEAKKLEKEEAERQQREAKESERLELTPILEAVYGSDFETARRAREFAEAAKQCCGGRVERVIQILDNELNAPYGRARRQEAIQRNIPGIANTEAGQRFLGHYRASDVDTSLSGAIAWLESQGSGTKKQTVVNKKEEIQPSVDAKPAAAGSLEALSQAWGAKLRK